MQDEKFDQDIYLVAKEKLSSLFNNIKKVKTLTNKLNIEINNYKENESTMKTIISSIRENLTEL
jgi:hypothetical protein